MRVLVTWGTKMGGTEGIARIIGEVLEHGGHDVVTSPAASVRDVGPYDAVIVGGALYANRWHRDARRFVRRHVATLRRIPVWLFSSGPLDDSAERQAIPPPPQVAALMEMIGARDHVTFGGRLAPDARGFPARAMAKTHSGDWRNPDAIRAWATDVARAIPYARPEVAIDHPGGSLARLIAHAAAVWALCAAIMLGLQRVAPIGVAVAIHAVLAPLVAVAIAVHYFRPHGAREPLVAALAFALVPLALDAAIVAPLWMRSLAMFSSVAGTWLPLALVFLATWLAGFLMSTMPWPRAPGGPQPAPAR